MKNNVSLIGKQYSWMIRADLILRRKGRLVVNNFGNIIFTLQKVIENAKNNWWRLKFLNPIDMSEVLPRKEREKLVDYIIEASHLKQNPPESIELETDRLSDRITSI